MNLKGIYLDSKCLIWNLWFFLEFLEFIWYFAKLKIEEEFGICQISSLWNIRKYYFNWSNVLWQLTTILWRPWVNPNILRCPATNIGKRLWISLRYIPYLLINLYRAGVQSQNGIPNILQCPTANFAWKL